MIFDTFKVSEIGYYINTNTNQITKYKYKNTPRIYLIVCNSYFVNM